MALIVLQKCPRKSVDSLPKIFLIIIALVSETFQKRAFKNPHLWHLYSVKKYSQKTNIPLKIFLKNTRFSIIS